MPVKKTAAKRRSTKTRVQKWPGVTRVTKTTKKGASTRRRVTTIGKGGKASVTTSTRTVRGGNETTSGRSIRSTKTGMKHTTATIGGKKGKVQKVIKKNTRYKVGM